MTIFQDGLTCAWRRATRHPPLPHRTIMAKLTPVVKELRRAARKGWLSDVRSLLNVHSELAEWRTDAFIQAATADELSMDVVRFLAPQVDASVALIALVRENAASGEILRLLLPSCDPREGESSALRIAAGNDDEETVAQLLPFSEPMARNSEALQHAARYGNAAMVAMLLPLSDADAAWRGLMKRLLARKAENQRQIFARAAEHLCGAVTDETLLNYADEYPDMWLRGPNVRSRVTALRLNDVLARDACHATRRARL